jgi:hypothetical protein
MTSPLTWRGGVHNTEASMDPLLTFFTTLGAEVLKDVATDTAKAMWSQAKSLLGLSDEDARVPAKVQDALAANPAAHDELKTLMQQYQSANQIIQTNHAENQGTGINFGQQTNHFGR